MENSNLGNRLVHLYTIGVPFCSSCCGAKDDKKLQCVPAVVAKVFGTQSVDVCIFQLYPRFRVGEDTDPGGPPMCPAKCPNLGDGGNVMDKDTGDGQAKQPVRKRQNLRLPLNDHYKLLNPRCLEWIELNKTMSQKIASLNPQLFGRYCGSP